MSCSQNSAPLVLVAIAVSSLTRSPTKSICESATLNQKSLASPFQILQEQANCLVRHAHQAGGNTRDCFNSRPRAWTLEDVTHAARLWHNANLHVSRFCGLRARERDGREPASVVRLLHTRHADHALPLLRGGERCVRSLRSSSCSELRYCSD